jgi:pyridoxamine 5'-phosphate oxidase family protein
MFTGSEVSFLREERFCRLATVSAKGWPHNVPVGYAFDGEFFYISSDPGDKKLRNIAANNRVCLVVDVTKKPRRAVMVQGYATLIERGPDYQRAMELFEEQRGWPRRPEGEQVVIKVRPVKKASWGL